MMLTTYQQVVTIPLPEGGIGGLLRLMPCCENVVIRHPSFFFRVFRDPGVKR